MRLIFTALLALACLPQAFPQQAEDALRRAFEGQTVVVKMDMPGTSDGVDVSPTAAMPVDYRKVADRIKHYGVGLHQGDSVMVTKVVLKKDHIEFQLGGGGFGTFSDRSQLSSSTMPTQSYEYKSSHEKDVEEELKYESDYYRRQNLREELDQLRHDRTRDNAQIARQNARAVQERQAQEKDLRAQDGSRFNLWYKGGFPEGAFSPDGVRDALAKYVDFDAPAESARDNQPENSAPPQSSQGTAVTALRKGQTIGQVEKILGPATAVNQNTEGSLKTMTREYETSDGLNVKTKFVGGVLIDFVAAPGR